MQKIAAILAALGIVSGTAHAAEGDPVVFQPTGGWTADFGEDYCRLVRSFSDGTNQISFALERNQPGGFMNVLLVGDAIKLYRRADTVGYNYLPSGNDRTTQLLRSKSGDGQQMLIMSAVVLGPDFAGGAGGPPAGGPPAPGAPLYDTAAEAGFADTVTGLALTTGTLTPVRIETGPLKGAVGVLQDCTYDLLSYWGLDGARHRTLSRTIVAEDGTILPPGTVGFEDFGKLGGGANMVRLMIDPAGKPQECKIHSPTLDDTTNRKICDHLMGKAKFLPALDSAGQPIASYWINSPFFMFGPLPGG